MFSADVKDVWSALDSRNNFLSQLYELLKTKIFNAEGMKILAKSLTT